MDKIYIAVNDNVFVKEIKQEMKIGSMYMPDSLDNDFIYGEVVSVSEGYWKHSTFVPSIVGIGDIIAFPKISGVKVTLNDMNLIRLKQEDIVAKQIDGKIEE